MLHLLANSWNRGQSEDADSTDDRCNARPATGGCTSCMQHPSWMRADLGPKKGHHGLKLLTRSFKGPVHNQLLSFSSGQGSILGLVIGLWWCWEPGSGWSRNHAPSCCIPMHFPHCLIQSTWIPRQGRESIHPERTYSPSFASKGTYTAHSTGQEPDSRYNNRLTIYYTKAWPIIHLNMAATPTNRKENQLPYG